MDGAARGGRGGMGLDRAARAGGAEAGLEDPSGWQLEPPELLLGPAPQRPAALGGVAASLENYYHPLFYLNNDL